MKFLVNKHQLHKFFDQHNYQMYLKSCYQIALGGSYVPIQSQRD